MNTILKFGACAVFASTLLVVSPKHTLADNPATTTATSSYDIAADSAATSSLKAFSISGTLQASFSRDYSTGMWTAHAAGSYSGIGGNAAVADTFIFGANDEGTDLGTLYLATLPENTQIPSPFQFSVTIPAPDLSWTRMGFGIHITDSSGGYANIRSELFPVIWEHPVVLNHAIGGTILNAPNYVPGSIPPGIGIPYSLINAIPEGNYYAVVFFKGLIGCPTTNYWINSFMPGGTWGYDTGGPLYSKAWSTSAGGCMQDFHIDPKKDVGWMWGALSNTGTADAIADENGIPAFAICGTKIVCDTIAPSLASSTPPQDPPIATSTPPERISSVLFLPGIKGSNLYERNPACIVVSLACDISLWLPISDVFASKLFLNGQGKTIENAYTKEKDILSDAFGYSFYDSFIQMMNKAQEDGTYGSGWRWMPVSYDWRLSLSDLLAGGVQNDDRIYYGESSTLPYIEKSLRELASTSPTGKVTIIAHSNGGLVAKALLEKLGITESTKLVDSLIMVGVPQSGAPRALGALLYGEGENIPSSGILRNAILSPEHARKFGLNSPMAYHLLPSAAYLDLKNFSYPLITFGAGALLQKARDLYGETIDTAEELREYALGTEGRSMPNTSDLDSANVLNPELLTYAQTTHAALDTWTPPEGIEVYQIGGYGIDTISGIDLYQEPSQKSTSTISYRPLFTLDGDGTVPLVSAFLLPESTHFHASWINLALLNESGYSHGNLLEMPYIQNTITGILQGNRTALESKSVQETDSLQRLQLAFFLHGAGALKVTDSQGRSAGVLSTGSKEEIPGSESGTLGTVTYVIVPSTAEYRIHLSSDRENILTLDMEELTGDHIIASSTIAEIPFNPSTTASLTLHDSIQNASPLQIDTNGDTVTDFEITPVVGKTIFPPDPSGNSATSTTATSSSSTTLSSSGSGSVTHTKSTALFPTHEEVATSTFISQSRTSASTTATSLRTPATPLTNIVTTAVVENQAAPTSVETPVASTMVSSNVTSSKRPQTETAVSSPISLWQKFLQFLRRVLKFFF